jgi:putative iron-regulated protein
MLGGGESFMHMGLMVLPLIVMGNLGSTADAGRATPPSTDEIKREVVRAYADTVHDRYAKIHRAAKVMQGRIRSFASAPSDETLAAARKAWIEGRRVYGPSEAFRFYEGPIDTDGLETLINAWPLDEATIDAVRGDPDAGIINKPSEFPNLGATILSVLNQRGGETNVTTGWHAIEFLLWGQDHNRDGPGQRSPSDYIAGEGKNAERRTRYLLVVTDLLLEHLAKLEKAWAPGAGEDAASGSREGVGSYRRAFEAAPVDESLQKMLTGITVLCGFELSGERLVVPLETQDQEEEHSCFSDTTHEDFIANGVGVREVYLGRGGPGLHALAERVDPVRARAVKARLARMQKALEQIPVPFDRAILGEDSSPGRRAVLTAVEAVEDLADELAALGESLGLKVPLKPEE